MAAGFWRHTSSEPFMEGAKRLLGRMWRSCWKKPNKPKQWKPDALETVMYAAAQGSTHPVLVVSALKTIAVAAGYFMPKPEITFQDEAVEFVWKSKNKHVLCMWLKADGKLDFVTTENGEAAKQDDESIRNIPMEMMSHFFVAWGAR